MPEKEKLLLELAAGWAFTHDKTRLFRDFSFVHFQPAPEFANKVGEIAEEQWHHPELHVGWGHCGIEIWTHKIGDLVESDFILAAKIDEMFSGLQS